MDSEMLIRHCSQLVNLRNRMIKVIDYKKPIFYIIVYDINCQFIPIELYTDKAFLPIPKKVKGSTLGWYINRKWVSYNQIRQSIREYRLINKTTTSL
jgi:hypothetical protein